jgi:hypothetical protein
VQQAEELFFPSIELITAAAQPTPGRTLRASTGQFREQAPHSMQASRFAISTFPLAGLKTARGQTRRQVPQPTHFSSSSFKVTTSLRYSSWVIFSTPYMESFEKLPFALLISLILKNDYTDFLVPMHFLSVESEISGLFRNLI